MLAFVGFSLAVMVTLFVVFCIDAINWNENNQDGILASLFGAAWLAFFYGIFASIASAGPFILLGGFGAFIGWKLKLIRWWTCLLGGGLLSMLPLSPVFIFGTVVSSSIKGRLPDSLGMDMLGFLALGLCGSIAGFCFWLTLRFLRFPDIDGPVDFSKLAQ